MNGIDISSYQKGINLAVVPCDFVIVKATQGKSYKNPDFDRAIAQAKQQNKLIGVYHYANGCGIKTEADWFLNVVKNYIGEAILVLDWEGYDNPQFTNYGYAVEWMKYVHQKTGIKPFLYMSKSVCHAYNWAVIKDYPIWIAQYANMKYTGYQLNPWTDKNTFGVWNRPQIYQYSSRGRLPEWSGNLDLDIAYITPQQWKDYASKDISNNLGTYNPTIAGEYTVVASVLNVRSGPGMNYPVINQLKKGTRVYNSGIYGINGTTTWYKIKTFDAKIEGYVSKNYLI